MVYSQFFIGSEIFERLRSSKYTPSVSLSLDSSLREGAGRAVPFIVPPGNRKVAGDFHRPYETQKPFPFTIHWGTLPQSRLARQLPRGGSWEERVPFNVSLGNRKVAGDFHRPYETLNVSHFTIHRSTLPQSRFARQLPQRGSRDGVCTIQRVARKAQGCGRFSSPLRNSKTVSLYHSSGYTPSEREPGGYTIQRAVRKPEGCGRFSSPLRNSEDFTLYRSTSPPKAVRGGIVASKKVLTKKGF